MVQPGLNIEKIVNVIWVGSLLIFACLSFYFISPNFTIHQYRQAQTAMTALYLPIEGFQLNYLTPIMGFPWTVPLEFPIFQWLAVGINKISGADLIISGKAVNIVCHLINNLLIIQICRMQKIDKLLPLIGLVFYNLFPFYLVFDSVFLIDSFSLTLNFGAIYFLSRFIETNKILHVSLFFFFATLTGLSKSTTFIGVLAPITAVLLLLQLIQNGGFSNLFKFKQQPIKNIYIAGGFFLLAFGIMYAWVVYTDAVKLQNPLSAQWTSVNTSSWNFGTLEQRLSFANWKQYFTYSMIAHPVSYILIAGGLITFLFFSDKKQKILGLCLVLFFITPLLFFFNLFLIHTYYSIANFIFLFFLLAMMVVVFIRQPKLIVRAVGVGFGLILLLFGVYRSYAFRSQVLKNIPETGVYGQLNKIEFKPGMNDVMVVVQPSRDPFLEYYFKCRGINLNRQEYEMYGKADKLKKFSGDFPIRMICIVDSKILNELPTEFNGILPREIKHLSLSHLPESSNYYNFFWY